MDSLRNKGVRRFPRVELKATNNAKIEKKKEKKKKEKNNWDSKNDNRSRGKVRELACNLKIDIWGDELRRQRQAVRVKRKKLIKPT